LSFLDELMRRIRRGDQADLELLIRNFAEECARDDSNESWNGEPTEILPAVSVPVGDKKPPEQWSPPRLGDFELLREVGRGGMGIVYEARQLSLNKNVALKILPVASVLDQRNLQRFQNEARAAAQLQHPNIVPVHAVGSDRGVHYYVCNSSKASTSPA
jgi:hypothetical protein